MMLESFIISGIMMPPLKPDWKHSSYLLGLKKEFEEIHKNHFVDKGVSAIGVLRVREFATKTVLVPEYIMHSVDGTVQSIRCHTEPVSISELITDEELIKEIKADGYLIVMKFQN